MARPKATKGKPAALKRAETQHRAATKGAKARAAKNGAAKNGAAKNGAAKSGAAKNGAGKPAGQSGDKPKGAKPRAEDKAEARKAKLRAIKEAAARAEDSESGDGGDDQSKRNFGLRGAAPWVARHAAKHAEELRRRNAEPPPPGSARATLRTPKEAEQIKNRIAQLHQRASQINSLRKKLDKSFVEIGDLLTEIQSQGLHEAKGYANFEAFIDREIEIPRITALKLMRIVQTFDREAALDYPLERLMSALSALDGELMAVPPSQAAASSRGFSSTALPPKPPIRWD
jgi:hypothetical protein